MARYSVQFFLAFDFPVCDIYEDLLGVEEKNPLGRF